MDLLAAEITARTGKRSWQHYQELTPEHGTPYYVRIDAPATPDQKARLLKLSPDAVSASSLAGEPILAKMTRRPATTRAIGGLKVTDGERLVRRAPVGHGRPLQDLRGELQGHLASQRDRQPRLRTSCSARSDPQKDDRESFTHRAAGVG